MAAASSTNGVAASLPAEVTLGTEVLARPRFTPRELSMIKDECGRPFSAIIADVDSDDKFVVYAWLKLRRDGYDVSFADMADVVIDAAGGSVDPTIAPPSTTSPRSATSGE